MKFKISSSSNLAGKKKFYIFDTDSGDYFKKDFSTDAFKDAIGFNSELEAKDCIKKYQRKEKLNKIFLKNS
jgi:hypothetical protein